MLIAFPIQQRLHELTAMLYIRTLPVLLISFNVLHIAFCLRVRGDRNRSIKTFVCSGKRGSLTL
jgi:hypothetical protein